MSNLVEHAKREFESKGWPGDDEAQGWVCENILELLEVFSNQGHSGTSAPYVLSLFSELARFNPIGPLTGEANEWIEHADGTFQNKRCTEVFKQGSDGTPYWIRGRVFRRPDGLTYTNRDSSVEIEFPWVKPKPEIVDVAA